MVSPTPTTLPVTVSAWGGAQASASASNRHTRALRFTKLQLAADSNIQPCQRLHDLHDFQAHSADSLKQFERTGRVPDSLGGPQIGVNSQFTKVASTQVGAD